VTDIRYVCLSDLHLGEEDSILTALNENVVDSDNPSPVMIELVKCLKELILKNKGTRKPTLILNGDILELALSTTNISTMVLERLLELFMKKEEELFEKIIYIPGNHDHHMWEQIRETQYPGISGDIRIIKCLLHGARHRCSLKKRIIHYIGTS